MQLLEHVARGAVSKFAASALDVARQVLSGRVVQVVQVAILVEIVLRRAPHLGDLAAHAIQRTHAHKVAEDGQALLVLDGASGQGLSLGYGVVPVADGLLDGVLKE